jgi:hypothetical protein
MATIVRQTRYGNTMFLSSPVKAAKVIVMWAVEHYHSLCGIENLNHGCIRVNIPGVTRITLAPEKKP